MDEYNNSKPNDDNLNEANKFFNELNASLGFSLTELYEPQHIVKGREKELHQIDIKMARPLTPVSLLLGLAGAGKTSLVESWKKIQQEKGKNIVLLSLSLGAMSAQGKETLQMRLETLMPKLKQYQDILRKTNPFTDVVLFIDEVHMIVSIFGKGSKLGGDLLKTSLARPPVKVIAATTRNEYDTYVANDGPLARRFKNSAINEVNKSVTKDILRNWLDVYMPPHLSEMNNSISDTTLEKIINANHLYRPQFAEPAKSIDILESAIGISDVENIPITDDVINRIFKEDFNVQLDFKANYDKVFNTIVNRVKGQPMALYTVERAVKKLTFNIDSSNRPKATMLFIGSSGTGKTEMTKALSEGIYSDESHVVTFNMSDYANGDNEPQFRRDLGTAIRHDSSAIILFDEMEKAHKYIMQALLPILDEGIVRFSEKGADDYIINHEISLRNTIIIATSNVAADLFKDVHQFSKERKSITQENMNIYTKELKQEYQNMEIDIYKALTDAFSPEFVGRFSNIVPFYALHESTLLDIATNSIMKLLKSLNNRPDGYKIEIKKPKDWSYRDYNYVASEVAMYITFELADIKNSNFGGARAIKRYVENELYMSILDAIFEHPDKRRFQVSTNGKSAFESEYTKGYGDIIVRPAN